MFLARWDPEILFLGPKISKIEPRRTWNRPPAKDLVLFVQIFNLLGFKNGKTKNKIAWNIDEFSKIAGSYHSIILAWLTFREVLENGKKSSISIFRTKKTSVLVGV